MTPPDRGRGGSAEFIPRRASSGERHQSRASASRASARHRTTQHDPVRALRRSLHAAGPRNADRALNFLRDFQPGNQRRNGQVGLAHPRSAIERYQRVMRLRGEWSARSPRPVRLPDGTPSYWSRTAGAAQKNSLAGTASLPPTATAARPDAARAPRRKQIVPQPPATTVIVESSSPMQPARAVTVSASAHRRCPISSPTRATASRGQHCNGVMLQSLDQWAAYTTLASMSLTLPFLPVRSSFWRLPQPIAWRHGRAA